jgi:hypothetical protein
MTARDFTEHVEAQEAVLRGDYAAARDALSRIPAGGAVIRMVRVDPDVFERYHESEDGAAWETSPAFLVVTPDPEAAVPALQRAARRIKSVTGTGREYAVWEEEWEEDAEVEAYTPNWVSDIHVAEAGLVVHADTKGYLPSPQGRAMLRILVDELVADGIRALITREREETDFATTPSRPVWDDLSGPRVDREVLLWVVARDARIDVGDGRWYQESEYWGAGDGWTFDKSAARRWPYSEVGDAVALAHTLPADDGPVTVVGLEP